MDCTEALELDASNLCGLADRIAAVTSDTAINLELLSGLARTGDNFRAQERRLDVAAWSLRRRWLALAHRPADATAKSPCEGHGAHVAGGGDVEFGYERDLDVSVLEQRRLNYMPSFDGWSNELVLFRSGQAALTSLLQWAIAALPANRALRVSHAGAYFETRALLDAWPDRVVAVGAEDPDVIIGEPVWCDGQFGCETNLVAPRVALLVDTTMSGPAYDIGCHLKNENRVVIVYSSGLKLDQAGLELANVGIVRIYAKDSASDVARALRRLRALTGTGLTLDELSALSAPWFMDRNYADDYTQRLFANNRALAQSVGRNSELFASRCHPCLEEPDAVAPFCAFELREPSPSRYRALLAHVESEIDRRDLLAARGGSFGFRGHRYELIEPESGQGRSFLRVAMGWRDGHSRQGLCDLFSELSSRPTALTT